MKRKFYILILVNRVNTPLTKTIKEFKDWLRRHTPLEPEIDVKETNLDTKLKSFGVYYDNKSPYYGLDGIKQKIRNTGLVPANTYHSVIFIYALPSSYDFAKTPVAAFTYLNPLVNTTTFSEIPFTPDFGLSWIYQELTHEIVHALIRLAWWKKIVIKDDMDLYDEEMNPEASNGNRARNLRRLEPYWNKIIQEPKAVSILKQISLLASKAVGIMLKMSKSFRIVAMAKAIQEYEGWFVGSRSWRNNNPGNLKFNHQKNAVMADPDGFAIFKTYKDGFNALVSQLEAAFNGTSAIYNPDMTLIEFFEKYSPQSDGNEPVAYANFIARKLKISPQTKLKNI